MPTVLVTGAAGFIGSHTCECLVGSGNQVIGVDNFRTGRRENLQRLDGHGSFKLLTLDVTDVHAFDFAVASAKPDALIHLAALVSVPESIQDSAANFRQNLEATFIVAEAARRHHVSRVVFASSAAVYGNATDIPLREQVAAVPLSPYGGAKLASESVLFAHASTFGFTVRCQRYFNVFGLRQDPHSPYSGVISIFAERLKRALPPTIFGDGEQTRDFISVHDVARANVMAAVLPGLNNGVANICTGKATSLNRLVEVLRKLYCGVRDAQHAAERLGDIRHSVGSPDRARAEMGFSASISLEDGLAELVQASGKT